MKDLVKDLVLFVFVLLVRGLGTFLLTFTAWYCAIRGYYKAMWLFIILTFIFSAVASFIRKKYWNDDEDL